MHYFSRKNSLYFLTKGEAVETLDIEKEAIRLSGAVDIVARTQDENGDHSGIIIELTDVHGRTKQTHIYRAELAVQPYDIKAKLSSLGLYLNASKKAWQLFCNYLLSQTPRDSRIHISTIHAGWCNDAFVLGDNHTLGEQVIYAPMGDSITASTGQRGTLKTWQSISALAAGNSRLVFAISAAVAAPLLRFTDISGVGFHFYGESSIGKTTLMKVAASTIGPGSYINRWRATDNALEKVCYAHNDLPLLLDEIGQVPSTVIGDICYMMVHGQSKARATEAKTLQWRTLFLSTGELSVEKKIANGSNQTVRAGQIARVISIPAEKTNLGILENLHGICDSKKFIKKITQLTDACYGAVLPRFIQHIIDRHDLLKNDGETLSRLIDDFTDEFIRREVDDRSGSQITRIAKSFALVAFAGEQAIKMGLINWEEGESYKAVAECFKDFKNDHGTINNKEKEFVLNAVSDFFTSNMFAFPLSNDSKIKSNKLYGFKHINKQGKVEYLLLSKEFNLRLANQFDSKLIKKYCIEAGWLIPYKAGELQTVCRIKALNSRPVKVYRFTDEVVASGIKNSDIFLENTVVTEKITDNVT